MVTNDDSLRLEYYANSIQIGLNEEPIVKALFVFVFKFCLTYVDHEGLKFKIHVHSNSGEERSKCIRVILSKGMIRSFHISLLLLIVFPDGHEVNLLRFMLPSIFVHSNTSCIAITRDPLWMKTLVDNI